MRTTTSKPSRSKARPAPALQDSAPSLEKGRRKLRAKDDLPAPAPAAAEGDEMPAHELAVIEAAMAILRARLRANGEKAGSPKEAHLLALLKLAERETECFAVMFLDTQNRLIAFDEMFQGTLTQTSVYPREVVRKALGHNAAAAILVHNHPSGRPEPSHADELLTRSLRDALALVDVRVPDHLIVAGDRVLSFAERGLI